MLLDPGGGNKDFSFSQIAKFWMKTWLLVRN